MEKQLKEALEHKLKELINKAANPECQELIEAASYLLLSEGKRLRPLLLLHVATHYGASLDQCLAAAAAIEMVHTYSLIHDDLPCMDNDDFRRGRPSLHRAFSESTALLAGDFLLTTAFETLASAETIEPKLKVALIATLSHAAGGWGMVGGQYLDLKGKSNAIELQISIALKKTAALFKASFYMAAMIAKLEKKQTAALCSLGENLGLFYQLIDDIHDESFDDSRMQIAQKLYHTLIQQAHFSAKENIFLIELIEQLGSECCDAKL